MCVAGEDAEHPTVEAAENTTVPVTVVDEGNVCFYLSVVPKFCL